MEEKMITTVNFHLTKACNMKCKYCFAGFNNVESQIDLINQMKTIKLLKEFGLRKINFVGGEPFLIKQFEVLLKHASNLGFITSIVTNGTLITEDFLGRMHPFIDMIGVSIDSLNTDTNMKIGRETKVMVPDRNYYSKLCKSIKGYGIDLKVNTVVSKLNYNESYKSFIEEVNPLRWKIFQVMEIEGENSIADLEVTKEEFNSFVELNNVNNVSVVSENNDLMRGSYLMIDPLGRFFDNTNGGYSLSQQIAKVGVEQSLREIQYSVEKFELRDGNYYKQTKNIA
jgi:radical S-adenosyl methionine domain-containing protein 2